jgi:hypothetical protein
MELRSPALFPGLWVHAAEVDHAGKRPAISVDGARNTDDQLFAIGRMPHARVFIPICGLSQAHSTLLYIYNNSAVGKSSTSPNGLNRANRIEWDQGLDAPLVCLPPAFRQPRTT